MKRALLLLLPVLAAAPAGAALIPSTDLAFRVTARPDSITVGDPVVLTLEARAPAETPLLLPQPADSIGPFTVLDAEAPVVETKDGRLTVTRTVRVTLFRTGESVLPALSLLSPRAGSADTLVALSQPIPVRVRPVLQGKADPSNLKDLKKPVPLARTRWWLWALIAVAAVGAAWLVRGWLRRRRRAAGTSAAPAPPPLPPEVAFAQGLDALRGQRLPERGLVREYYFELSMLFRRYVEDRFGFAAAEETRTEILERAARLDELRPDEVDRLSAWLEEGDLVKFAKMDRLLREAEAYTDRAVDWVRATAAARPQADLAAAAEPAPPGPPAGAAAASEGGAG
jgi:hypothetical protein